MISSNFIYTRTSKMLIFMPFLLWIGKPLDPHYKVKIDPETEEVLLAGQNVFSGYLNREDATKACLAETDGEVRLLPLIFSYSKA